MLAVALSLAVFISIAHTLDGNSSAPFPNPVYPNRQSPNPAAAASSERATSLPFYPSPWISGAGDWGDSVLKARSFVKQLTLLEKVNLTTGVGWRGEACVGNTGAVPRLGFPSLCLQDGPVGIRWTDYVSAFPAGVNIAATFDRGLAFARGQAIGSEARDKGVDISLGPVAGPLGRAPEGGRNWEGFSPDPVLTGILLAQTIQGIQSAGVVACAKHFIGNEQEHFRQSPESTTAHGQPISESASSNIDDATLHELYLWPFADAVRAGVGAVMCSYQQVNNSYACQNSHLLNHILKDELDFQGFVMSDWQAQHAGVDSALAGLDMSMPGDVLFESGTSFWGANLTLAVLNGTVPEWRLDDMATRIVAAFYHARGDNPRISPNFHSWAKGTYGFQHDLAQEGFTLVNQHVDVRREHGNLIRQIGAASTVLLKNTKNALPLTGKKRMTAVFGEDAGSNPRGPNGCGDRNCDDGTLAMGWGSGTTNFPYLVTPETAIQNEIVSHFGRFESITDNFAGTKINALAAQADVAIVFVNADSGEGFLTVDGNLGDRNNLTLWKNGDVLVQNVSALCNNTIVVIHSVGPVVLGDFPDHPNITAILWAGLPGEQSGNAIADILFGRVNPSAKLPFTIGKTRADYGTDVLYFPNEGINSPQINFTEGVFIDYRAFGQANITPAYEFGYGLSYTTFAYSNLKVKKLSVGGYTPSSGQTAPAPELGTVRNHSASEYYFPDTIDPVFHYIYPYLNQSDVKETTFENQYAQSVDLPPGAQDGSPQPIHPAGGAPGGNPELYDVLYQVTATITNTGSLPGSEVPQLYLSLGGPYDPKVVLRGFERLSIQPGTSTEFHVDLTRRDLSNWDTAAQNWVISKYNKTVYVGSSSRKLHLKAQLG